LHAVYSTSLAGKLTEYLKSEKNPSAIGFCRQTGFAEYHPHDLMAARKAFTNINTPSDLDSLDLT
jgi:molybdopterin-guanine dinucleotide biosynthesis protein A